MTRDEWTRQMRLLAYRMFADATLRIAADGRTLTSGSKVVNCT